MQDLQVALQPVLSVIADVISKVAEWISNNPKLAATITAVAMAIGIISGAIMALAPIVMTVMSFFEIGALAKSRTCCYCSYYYRSYSGSRSCYL